MSEKNISNKADVIKEINSLNDFIYDLKISDKYIAKSEYINKIKEYKETVDFFNVLIKGNLLEDYCLKNKLSFKGIKELLNCYKTIDDIIEKHNDKFIEEELVKEKDYLDNILKDVDPNISLDRNQREVVLNNEDYILVIAGAGAGKTTTVAAKAKYLVEKLNVPANEILIVSFTNKAVDELRERINKSLKLDCIISTFHSIGNAILKTQSSENPTIIMESKLYYILLDYFKKAIFTNEKLTKKLVLFFSTYFDVPNEVDDVSKFLNDLSRTTYTTLKSDLNEFKQEIIDRKTKKKETILNEIVRSYQEVQIANYLYLNNLDYKYEPIYPYNIRYANKPYTPDFVIKQGDNVVYLEHFGISQNGENSLYNKEQLEKYKKAVNDKVLLHKEHNTKLIYTFSSYSDGRTLVQHLDEELRKNNFKLKKKDDSEVLNKLIESEENKYVSKLIILICRFINLFKTNGYTVEKFDIFKKSTNSVRNQIFLDISKECYLEYQRYLSETNSIDFQDMINNSAILLEEMAKNKEKLRFKYVIVDEYQDISKQRFDLVGALHKVCDAKIIAVGDDWQAIYSFSGSDVELFLDFQKKMGYAKTLKIENTYRNSQEVIDIAGNFIQKNDVQIKKTLKSPKHIEDPIIIYTYDQSRKFVDANDKSGAVYNMALTVEKCLDDIIKYNKKENKKNSRILIIGRYGFDGNNLQNSGLFEFKNKYGKLKSNKYQHLDITFMTAHASKGLGYDDVIIINCQNARFGFPSKIQDDPVLKHVLIEDNSYAFAEERRLFYVAMTRTKNRVYCVAPQKYPSEFLVELKHDYEKIVKHGEWTEDSYALNYESRCPICGYPMQFKYKQAYGLRLYICTNDPEVCGFVTNDKKAGKMQIMKCDKCQDGYMIVKSGKNGYFLGCTNYKNDGTGCNNVVSKDKYYEMFSLTPDKPIEIKKREEKKIEKAKDLTVVPDKRFKYTIRKYDLNNNLNDLYTVTKIIIICVDHVSKKKYLGTYKIAEILKGNKKIDVKGFDCTQINEYGVLKECKKDDLIQLIQIMVDNNLLLATKGMYPVLHPTTEGKEYYRNANRDLINKIHKEYLKSFESKEIEVKKELKSNEIKEETEKQEPIEIKKETEKQKPKKKSLLETIFGSISKQ